MTTTRLYESGNRNLTFYGEVLLKDKEFASTVDISVSFEQDGIFLFHIKSHRDHEVLVKFDYNIENNRFTVFGLSRKIEFIKACEIACLAFNQVKKIGFDNLKKVL